MRCYLSIPKCTTLQLKIPYGFNSNFPVVFLPSISSVARLISSNG